MSEQTQQPSSAKFFQQCPNCTCWGPIGTACPSCDWHYPGNPDIQPRADVRLVHSRNGFFQSFRYGLHMLAAMVTCGAFGLAEGFMYTRTGGSYGGTIALMFLGLMLIGTLARIAWWLLEIFAPNRVRCPNCQYDLSAIDGLLQPGSSCPSCDARLA